MAFLSSNPHTYMTKWLETATGGSVKAEFSLFNKRMRLRCLKCNTTHTSPEPEGETIDFSVQEFVKLHAHKPGESWTCYNCEQTVTCSLTEHAAKCPVVGKGWPKPKPVTLDFKPAGKIDLNPDKEAKIKEVADKLDKEYAAKLDDNAIAAKIKALQAEDQGKPVPPMDLKSLKENTPFLSGMTASKTGWHHTVAGIPVKEGGQTAIFPFKVEDVNDDGWGEATDAELAQAESVVAKQKAIENAMKIKLLQAQLADLTKVTEHVQVGKPSLPPEPAKPDGIMVTGRKFR